MTPDHIPQAEIENTFPYFVHDTKVAQADNCEPVI